jgi:hypothetical protein
VVTPNQTLSAPDVDRRIGGSAGGVLQTSQRVEAAIGQASIGAVFFRGHRRRCSVDRAGFASGHPEEDFSAALIASVAAKAILFCLAALVLGAARSGPPAVGDPLCAHLG